MLLALAICDICPASDVDVIISLLMDLFDTRSSLVNLVKLMVDREIAHTGEHDSWSASYTFIKDTPSFR